MEKVLELARKNPDWGYDRIASVMQYLNFHVSSSTVRKILDDYGIVPDPEKRARGDWNQFWDTQEAVTSAIDYAQTEVFYPFGMVRYSSFFCMNCVSREVVCGGVTHIRILNGLRRSRGTCAICGTVFSLEKNI